MDGHFGRLEVVCGSMFCGKSEELIRRMRRAMIAKQKIQVFKPNIDDRYKGIQKITSHSGYEIDCIPVKDSEELKKLLDNEVTVIAVDEAQFFDPNLISVIDEIVDQGIRVIAAGLDMDFRGEPFGIMPLLLAKAERVDKLQAICMVCGEAASRTQRLVNGEPAFYDDPIVVVGAAELYEARCRIHHQVPHRGN
ncbi:MAG: thymidine kinase [Anaerolineaceae bacterium]|nr:thymidine kinase [Anaerolineaceae bacterium]